MDAEYVFAGNGGRRGAIDLVLELLSLPAGRRVRGASRPEPPEPTMKYAHEFIDIACSHDAAMALFEDPTRQHEGAGPST